MFGVLLGECIDIRYSQGEYNWLEAWIVKTFSGFLAASFGSEASSRFKKISFLTFTSVIGQVLAYAFSKLPGGFFSFSLAWIYTCFLLVLNLKPFDSIVLF